MTLLRFRVEDKQIELAITSDSTLLDDAGVDDAGILVRVTGDDKSFTWKNATKAWTSSEHMDIVTGKTYKIGGTDVLSTTTLASSEFTIEFALYKGFTGAQFPSISGDNTKTGIVLVLIQLLQQLLQQLRCRCSYSWCRCCK